MPKISVIIPVYNNVGTIERALQSAISQEGAEKEILVWDGGSTDGTVEIIKKYADQLNYWHSQPDDGPTDAYNRGIKSASGEIISILNADDWLEPGILKTISGMFTQKPDLEIITTEAAIWQKNLEGELKQIDIYKGQSQELSPLGTPMPNARFYKKSIFETYGYFEEKNHLGTRMIACDVEHLLRLSLQQIKHLAMPRIGYNYFSHQDSITFSKNPITERMMYDERAHIAEKYLQTDLAKTYSKRLKRWHRRGTLRMFFWHLSKGNMDAAMNEKKRGLTISPIAWKLDYWRMKLSGTTF